ncbi:MAG TPA: hypothetical protein VIL18_09830 [Longimicrobiales bacterium]
MRRFAPLSMPLLISFVLAAGCEDPVGPEFHWVYGTWDWTEACCAFSGGELTPASAGYALRLVLRREDRAELFRNDSLVVRTRFSIRRRDESPEGSGSIRFETAVDPGWFGFASREFLLVRPDDDVLELTHPHCRDCWGTLTFRRAP